MKKHARPVVRILMAGAALSLGTAGCKKDAPLETRNPPEPEVIEPTGNPPPPEEEEEVELPTWDEVKSGHPVGATNPPIPFLRVTPDGDCYKDWRGGMMAPRPGEVMGDRIQICEEGAECGTQIHCPSQAQDLLDAHAKGEAPVGKPIAPKPDDL